MRRIPFPEALLLIFSMIVLAQVATWLLPAGEYEREPTFEPVSTAQQVRFPEPGVVEGGAGGALEVPAGGTVRVPAGTLRQEPGRKVIPGSYHGVDASPLPWHAALTRIPRGLEKAAEIIFFVFIVGGVIEVVKRTGAINAAIGAAIRRFGQSPGWLVAGMLTLFALGSSTIGMAEEYMPFVPVLVAMCLAMGLDAVVALGIVYIGAAVGYGCAALNPFTVMIAKDIAGQPPGQAMALRWGLLVVCLAIGVRHLMAYVRRVQRDPEQSLVRDVDYSEGYDMPEDVTLTRSRVAVLAAFVAMIGVFVWGVSARSWYLEELAGLFMGLALVSAALGRLSPNATARAFTAGAADMTGTALLIGFARTIEVVLSEARVIDTVIHGVASLLSHAEALGEGAPVVSAWGMLAVQSFCNLLIPSGSGQAYVTMPIMAPLADITGVGRETAVFAYQFGDGFMNLVVPTNALLMGMLLLGRIPYPRWLRFALPFLLQIYVVLLIFLGVVGWMGLGATGAP